MVPEMVTASFTPLLILTSNQAGPPAYFVGEALDG